MAAGVPIIFSGGGEGERIISEYDLGWISPTKNYIAMAENIKKLTNNSVEINIKKMNCQSCAEKIFNRPKQISALNEYLLQLKD